MGSSKWSSRPIGFALAASALTLVAATVTNGQGRQTQAIDPTAVTRGATIFSSSCASCHGKVGRGTDTAPDLIRSALVLHDRMNALHGSELGPYLSTGPTHHFTFDKDQLTELSAYLVTNVNKTLRSGYSNEPTNLLSGDKKAGEAFFQASCATCHSTTGDLAGVGKRYDPATLQQKFIFPNSGPRGARTAPRVKKMQVTVTLPDGKSFSGELGRIDDFNVSLRDKDGVTQTFSRGKGVIVKTIDPYQGHVDLLDHYTDDDIHNMTTYLETLK
ncbi:c-type cytochrome [Granulicella sibirica]|uniref:Putative cytochrome c, associated with quino(Hemo)protein alcohol dehydrogenase n=1 Tax=Granulicella sibirica TaxID=2479048 RepID=A0A4Q0SV61_9BACT|nr:c-type cytochrome [Granulicella sibirica]RXH54647.1 putative cytochrome c, associated with quino(hemo)protein alcohol dehydrogenase [Granulicella sibirica]